MGLPFFVATVIAVGRVVAVAVAATDVDVDYR